MILWPMMARWRRETGYLSRQNWLMCFCQYPGSPVKGIDIIPNSAYFNQTRKLSCATKQPLTFHGIHGKYISTEVFDSCPVHKIKFPMLSANFPMKGYKRGKRYHVMTSLRHYIDVIMGTMASQITSLTVVYSIIYSGADQRKHQSSESLAFVRGIHRDLWIPHTKGQ